MEWNNERQETWVLSENKNLLGEAQKVFQGQQVRCLEMVSEEEAKTAAGKYINLTLMENLADLSEAEEVIEKASSACVKIREQGGSVGKVHGYLFFHKSLERDAEKKQKTEEMLQDLEIYLQSPIAVYDTIGVISGGSKREYRRIAEMLSELWEDGEETAAWGLKADQKYYTVGYMAAEMDVKKLPEVAEIVKNWLFGKKDGEEDSGWIWWGDSRLGTQFAQARMKGVLEGQTRQMESAFLDSVVLEEPEETITRAEINAQNTVRYEKAFYIEERVKAGVVVIKEKLQKAADQILMEADRILRREGLWAALCFLEYVLMEEGGIRKLSAQMERQLLEKAGAVRTRPVRQVVGGMTPEVQEKRIEEWKREFQLALAYEMKRAIAEQCMSGQAVWEQCLYAPVKAYQKKCKWAADKLETYLGMGNQEIGRNLASDETVVSWAVRKIEKNAEAVSAEEWKRQLAEAIGRTKEDVLECVAGLEPDLFWKTAFQDCMREKQRFFMEPYLRGMVAGSEKMLYTGSQKQESRCCITVPEWMMEPPYSSRFYPPLEKVGELYPEKAIRIERAKNRQRISCMQTGALTFMEIPEETRTAAPPGKETTERVSEENAVPSSEETAVSGSEETEKRLRFCKFCGIQLKKGVEKYCPACGAFLRL